MCLDNIMPCPSDTGIADDQGLPNTNLVRMLHGDGSGNRHLLATNALQVNMSNTSTVHLCFCCHRYMSLTYSGGQSLWLGYRPPIGCSLQVQGEGRIALSEGSGLGPAGPEHCETLLRSNATPLCQLSELVCLHVSYRI